MRTYVAEMKSGKSESFRTIEEKIFGGGDALAGLKAYEYTNGIGLNLAKLRARAEVFKRDTATIDEISNKALALKNIASEAHIEFLNGMPDYVSVIMSGLDTKGSSEELHAHALTLARANDALVQLRDEVQRVTSLR